MRLLRPVASLDSCRAFAAGFFGSFLQVFQEPGTPAADQICSTPGV